MKTVSLLFLFVVLTVPSPWAANSFSLTPVLNKSQQAVDSASNYPERAGMGPEATVTQTVNCGAVSAGLYTLPACAIAPNGNLVNRAILTYVSNNQTITTTPSQSLSITVSYQISQGANPNEIDQLLFVASWTPQWPPPSGYYWGIYSSVPPAFPGTTGTVSFTLTSPSSPGTYYLWFGFSPDYGFAQAANDFKTPLIGTPGYIKIVVQSQFVTTPSCGAWNLNLYQLPACAIVPNTSSISRALLTSVSVQSVTVPPGQSLSFDVGYQISQGANPNEIDQLMFIASWTPSWPPPAGYYFGIYNSIPPSSPGTSGSASFSLTAPMTPGTYYLWFVWDANFGYSQAASDFTIPLSTPAHITIVVESGITTTSMQSTTVTTISTSSVTIDGAMWNLVVTAYGAFPGYPKWGTGISTFGSGFYMDTPGGASLFIQRQFSVPTDSPNLSFTSWGNLDPVTVTISVNGETLATLEPPQTQKGGIPQTYQFSMSKWAGQTVTVRISQISWGATGTLGWYKNIVISTVKSWTFMVYMAADNKLGPYAANNLEQMRQIGSSSSVNVIVLYDNQSSTELLEIGQGAYASWIVRQDYPTRTSDVNMADPATLRTFITWVVSNYPAHHYALVLWDHSDGAAWPSIPFQDFTSGGGGMTWQDFRNSLVAANTRFDVLGFDSCLQAMVEVASLIQKAHIVNGPPQIAVADYFVASEETEPPNGWPYDSILVALNANPLMSGNQFASTIVSSYQTRYESDETWQTTTLSAIRIDQPNVPNSLESLEYDVYQLGQALESNIATYRYPISAALNQTERYNIPPLGRRAGGGGVRLINLTVSDYFDLYDFCSHIQEQISDPLIQGYCTNLQSDLSSAVISHWADPRQHPNSHGLSVYLPPLIGSQTNATSFYLDPYDSLDFSLATGWNGFIRAYWNKFDFDITMSPSYGTTVPGGNVTFTVTVFLKGTNTTGLPVSLSINMENTNTGFSYLFDNNSTSTIQVTPPSTAELTILIPPSVPCATRYIFYLFGQSGQFTRPFISYINVACSSTVTSAPPPAPGVMQATTTTGNSTISTTRISYNLTAPAGSNLFTSNWSPLDGKVLGAPALSSSSTELYLFVRGVDNEVYYRDLNASQWNSWSHLPGASTSSTPALAVFNGQLYVAVTAQKFTILVNSMSLTTGKWSGWRSFDGLTRDGPALATSQDGSVLYILMRGIDNHVYYRTFAKNWSNWSPIPGPALALSAPSAVSYNNRLFVAVRGSWGSSNSAALLGNLSQSGLPIWSGWQQVGEGTVGPVSLSTDSSGVQQVLYVTMTMNNNLVYWRSFSYGGLFSTALQPILGVNATSAPSVAVLGGIMYRVVSCDQCAMSPYSQVFQQSQALARDASDVISLTTTETSNQVSDLTVVPAQSPIDSWSILGLTSFIMMFCLDRRRQRKLRSNY